MRDTQARRYKTTGGSGGPLKSGRSFRAVICGAYIPWASLSMNQASRLAGPPHTSTSASCLLAVVVPATDAHAALPVVMAPHVHGSSSVAGFLKSGRLPVDPAGALAALHPLHGALSNEPSAYGRGADKSGSSGAFKLNTPAWSRLVYGRARRLHKQAGPTSLAGILPPLVSDHNGPGPSGHAASAAGGRHHHVRRSPAPAAAGSDAPPLAGAMVDSSSKGPHDGQQQHRHQVPLWSKEAGTAATAAASARATPTPVDGDGGGPLPMIPRLPAVAGMHLCGPAQRRAGAMGTDAAAVHPHAALLASAVRAPHAPTAAADGPSPAAGPSAAARHQHMQRDSAAARASGASGTGARTQSHGPAGDTHHHLLDPAPGPWQVRQRVQTQQGLPRSAPRSRRSPAPDSSDMMPARGVGLPAVLGALPHVHDAVRRSQSAMDTIA